MFDKRNPIKTLERRTVLIRSSDGESPVWGPALEEKMCQWRVILFETTM